MCGWRLGSCGGRRGPFHGLCGLVGVVLVCEVFG